METLPDTITYNTLLQLLQGDHVLGNAKRIHVKQEYDEDEGVLSIK